MVSFASRGTIHTGLHAIDSLVFALWLVALGDNGWDVAAGLGMAMAGRHLSS
jgi:hypothetical protein